MNILVTGSSGFVGRNLVENLKNIRDGKDRTRPGIKIDAIYEYDVQNTREELDMFCASADFVFNLAGVNRPKDQKEFMEGNFGFASELLDALRSHGNTAPVMLASSIQATLSGRFGDSEYGRSKKAGEELFFRYAEETGAKVLVYRFPNLFGKWCRPNYNSAVATFCHNMANGLPIHVNDPSTELELLYIDDLVNELLDALEGHEHRCGFDGVTTIFEEQGAYYLIYDNTLELNMRKEHIIDDNFDRFIEAGYNSKELINVLLDAAKVTLEKKLKRNFKLALPFYYHNTETGENKIQLLAPLYFPGAPVKLALVLNKIKSSAKEYYEGVTVLPVEWAYMNSRLIVKPDEEWAKIMDEITSADEAESIREAVDMAE